MRCSPTRTLVMVSCALAVSACARLRLPPEQLVGTPLSQFEGRSTRRCGYRTFDDNVQRDGCTRTVRDTTWWYYVKKGRVTFEVGMRIERAQQGTFDHISELVSQALLVPAVACMRGDGSAERREIRWEARGHHWMLVEVHGASGGESAIVFVSRAAPLRCGERLRPPYIDSHEIRRP